VTSPNVQVHASEKKGPAKQPSGNIVLHSAQCTFIQVLHLSAHSTSEQDHQALLKAKYSPTINKWENGVTNYDFPHVRRKQLGELRSTNEKMTLTFDL